VVQADGGAADATAEDDEAPGGDGAAAADATPMAQRWLAFVKVQLILT